MKCTLLIFCVILGSVQCSKILSIFNIPSKSHSILGLKLAEGLIQKGHHVTFISPYDGDPMENLTYITLTAVRKNKELQGELFGPKTGQLKMMYHMISFLRNNTRLFWEHPEVQKMVKEKPKYDVVIMMCFFNDGLLGLARHLDAPVVFFNPAGSNPITNAYFANPNMPYTKNVLANIETDTLLQRAASIASNVVVTYVFDYMLQSFQDEIMRKNLPQAPSLQDLRQNVSLVLVNSHTSIEPARPYVPNMIPIGGFHLHFSKKLPADIKTYLDQADKGIILFCMGSNVQIKNFDKNKLEAIMKVLGEMSPIKVIFKSEIDLENVPKNVLVKKWIPQAEILAHRNTKVFISHGGYGGNTESVYHGVPILGIPCFGDQNLNLKDAADAEYATILEYDELTEELFRSKLKEILENPKYTENVKKRSSLMKEQPVSPMVTAIFWVEHVIKYKGGNHLRNAGMDLTWYQLYMIDIFIFYTIVLIILLIIQYYTLKYSIKLLKSLLSRNKTKLKSS